MLVRAPRWRSTTSLGRQRWQSSLLAPVTLSKEQRDAELARMNEEVSPLLKVPNGGDPVAVIEWAAKEFNNRVAMSTSMGLQAAVLLHMATQVLPEIPVVWVDTGYLPKETYHYAEELRQVLGLNLIVRSNHEWSAARLEAVHGKLWEKDDVNSHSLYGKLTKVDPMADGIASIQPSPLVLLSGLRGGQTKARASMQPVGFQQGRYKLLPMLKMSDEDVADYMDKYHLPKHPLQAKGYLTVGDWHSSRPATEGEDARATRFGGKFEECGLHVDSHEPASNAAGAASTEASVNATTPSTAETFVLPKGLESLGYVKAHEASDLAVIMVKKKLTDGEWCRKCKDVAEMMVADDMEKFVGHVAVADASDGSSEGVELAKRFEVATAPFFLIRTREEQITNANWRPIRSYLQLRKIIQDAVEAKSAKMEGNMEVEDPKLAEQRRHAEEIRTQIEILQTRLHDIETSMVEMSTAAEGVGRSVSA